MLDELDERAISKGQLPREKSAIRQQRCRTSVSWLPLQQHWLDRWKAKTYPAFIDSSPPHISRCELRSAQPHPRISGPAFRLKKYQKYLQDGARGLTHSQPLQDGRRGVPAGCRLRVIFCSCQRADACKPRQHLFLSFLIITHSAFQGFLLC